MKMYGRILLVAILVSSVFSAGASASSDESVSSSSIKTMTSTEVKFDASHESTLGIFDPNYKEKAKKQGLDPDTIIAGYYIPFEKPYKSLK